MLLRVACGLVRRSMHAEAAVCFACVLAMATVVATGGESVPGVWASVASEVCNARRLLAPLPLGGLPLRPCPIALALAIVGDLPFCVGRWVSESLVLALNA